MVAKVMAAPVAITAALVKATMALAAMLLVMMVMTLVVVAVAVVVAMMATLVPAHGQKHTSLSVSPARPTSLTAALTHARVPLAAQSPLKLGFAPTTLALVTLLVAYLYGPCGWPI